MRPTYRDVLAYFHHAGLISAATGDFERAVEMFSMVSCLCPRQIKPLANL
jgi:hypothetical protein